MSRSSVPEFAELLSGARRTAVHLEMRDLYGVGDEAGEIERFTRTGEITLDPTASWWPQWLGIVRETLARGVVPGGSCPPPRCGWHPAKTIRIQKGGAPPSGADIRTWCATCGADDQADDLIDTARAVDSMYLEWRRLHRTGMRRVQEDW